MNSCSSFCWVFYLCLHAWRHFYVHQFLLCMCVAVPPVLKPSNRKWDLCKHSGGPRFGSRIVWISYWIFRIEGCILVPSDELYWACDLEEACDWGSYRWQCLPWCLSHCSLQTSRLRHLWVTAHTSNQMPREMHLGYKALVDAYVSDSETLLSFFFSFLLFLIGAGGWAGGVFSSSSHVLGLQAPVTAPSYKSFLLILLLPLPQTFSNRI